VPQAPKQETTQPNNTTDKEEADTVSNNLENLSLKHSKSQTKPTNPDPIRRHDSQTNEIDEFHDAIA
jgi:hypothetical protein